MYDTVNPDNNPGICDTQGQKSFIIKEKHINHALCNIFLTLLALKIPRIPILHVNTANTNEPTTDEFQPYHSKKANGNDSIEDMMG